MKMLINSEINEAMENTNNESIIAERDKIIKEIEELKLQAQKVKETSSTEELSKINERIETLISEISAINKD